MSETFRWPDAFQRIPDEEWTKGKVEDFALCYDAVKHHGWYANLNPTLDEVLSHLRDGDRLLDYSGGTGIFTERLLGKAGPRPFGVVIVDSSPKFLTLALKKFRNDPRVAFRLIRYLKQEERLQFVDEVLNLNFDGVISTNAIHLYYDLKETLQSWVRVLKPRAHAYIQSGNIRNPATKPREWIIDETVEAIHRAAVAIVLESSRYAMYREVLGDREKMNAYNALRQKYFLPTRSLAYYMKALEEAGFTQLVCSAKSIEVRVEEWYDFLSVYHEGVLGWVGGTQKVDGAPAPPQAVTDRLSLLREAMGKVFSGKTTFPCCWTYITCTAPESR